jgi:hypothetical protein
MVFGPDAYQETQDDVGVQAVRPSHPDQGNGLPEGERLGRAAFLAGGCVSTSVATLRRTLSLASACLMARVSPACAMATVRVARVAARSFSADRTVAAVSSRSGNAPMMSMSGSRTGLVMLSWQEHIGSTIVHVLDLTSSEAYTAVTPAKGGFMRLTGRLEVKTGT